MKRRILLTVLLLVGIIGCIVSAIWMLFCIVFAPNSKRGWHIATAYDQLGNATTGGDMDETISSRAGRLRKQGRAWACALCWVLDKLDDDHCEKSIGS